MPPLSPIGVKLRHHRKHRGMSQLDLALQAETSPRYVSFIETGRSRPGRDVVLRLAGALELAPRETNELLIAAGLRPAFTERGLEEDAMEPVRRIVRQVLDNHEPYPGLALGPGHRIVMMNATARKLFAGIESLSPAEIAARWFPDQEITEGEVPVYTPTVTFDGQRVRTLTTVTRFDRARDVTTSELAVELMFPADAHAETFFREGAGGRSKVDEPPQTG